MGMRGGGHRFGDQCWQRSGTDGWTDHGQREFEYRHDQDPAAAANNAFTGNQAVNGNLSATGFVTGAAFQIGSNLFAFGSAPNANAYIGFAGNPSDAGTSNTGEGYQAFFSNTTGCCNVANGSNALMSNTTGCCNVSKRLQTSPVVPTR